MSESVLIFLSSMDSIPAEGAVEDATGSAQTFHDIPCVSQMLGGPSLRLGIPEERLSTRNWMRWERHRLTGNVGMSTAH